jgi:hypothetical protein
MDIAILDPVLCGNAIYDARVMLDVNVNDFSQPGIHSRMALAETIIRGKIYPNPAKTQAYYELELSESENGIFMLYDALGKQIQSYKMNPGSNKLILDLQWFSNGLYFYRVIVNGNLIEANKLEIQK